MAAAVKRVKRGKNYFEVRGRRVTEMPPLREDIYVLCERYVDELEQQNARDNTHLYPYLQLKIQVRSLVTNVQKDISFYANIYWFNGDENHVGRMAFSPSVFIYLNNLDPLICEYTLRFNVSYHTMAVSHELPGIIAEYDVEYHRDATIKFMCTRRRAAVQ